MKQDAPVKPRTTEERLIELEQRFVAYVKSENGLKKELLAQIGVLEYRVEKLRGALPHVNFEDEEQHG